MVHLLHHFFFLLFLLALKLHEPLSIISTPPWQFTPCVNTELHITFLTEWNHLRDVKWKTEWIAWEKNTGSHNLPFINSHKWEIHLKMEILKQPEKKITNQHFVFLFFFCKVASISCDSIPQKGLSTLGSALLGHICSFILISRQHSVNAPCCYQVLWCV